MYLFSPRPASPVKSYAQARWFVRVAALPLARQRPQVDFHQKNAYVLKHLFPNMFFAEDGHFNSMRRRGTWEPLPKKTVSSCAQAPGFVRVATLPRESQHLRLDFLQKNTYVLEEDFACFCRLLPIIQFLQCKVDLLMAAISGFGA